MSLALAGAPYGFNHVAADKQSGLNVAASIYDITSGTPIFVSKVPMVEVLSGSYAGVFTPQTGKVYDIISLVYLDPGFTTLDPDRAPGTETIQVYNFPSTGGGGGQTVYIFQSNLNLQGIIAGNQLSGTMNASPLLQGIVTIQLNIASC